MSRTRVSRELASLLMDAIDVIYIRATPMDAVRNDWRLRLVQTIASTIELRNGDALAQLVDDYSAWSEKEKQ